MTTVLLRGGWILEADGTTQRHSDVLVRDGVIVAVEDTIDAADAQVVDCADATVMPGLIDAHVHLAVAGGGNVAQNARDLLAAGVTTARDVGGPADVLLAQRAVCASDPSVGPHLLVCGEAICEPGGHGTELTAAKLANEVATPDEARAAVRRLKDIGADWVKVMLNGANMETELGAECLAAIVAEGRAVGLRVAAHASNAKAVALAVEGGVDSIEHGNGIDASQAAEMARVGMALVTTTYVFRAGAGCAHSHGPNPLDAFEPEARKNVETILMTRVTDHERAIPAARDAGVLIALGTDSVIGPIGTVADELEALTVVGLTPPQALRAGTTAGAQLLRLADRGRVAVGLRADLLVVPGRPDHDITAMRAPSLVMRAGHIIST